MSVHGQQEISRIHVLLEIFPVQIIFPGVTFTDMFFITIKQVNNVGWFTLLNTVHGKDPAG